MTIDKIQKMWLLIGGILTGFGFSWMPDFVLQLFGPEGTDLVFRAIMAISALWQFTKSRTNPNPDAVQPEALTKPASIMYTILPVWPASKA